MSKERKQLEEKAANHIRSTYNEHCFDANHKGVIKLMCDFFEAESQKAVSEISTANTLKSTES